MPNQTNLTTEQLPSSHLDNLHRIESTNAKVTLLEHNLNTRRITALVHLGDMVVKVDKRRDRSLTAETGLSDAVLEMALEDRLNKRANIVWELGK